MFDCSSNEVSLTAGNHTLTMTVRADGGFDLKGNGFTLAEMRVGGGRFQLFLSGSLPLDNNPDVGLVVDPDGYIHVEKG